MKDADSMIPFQARLSWLSPVLVTDLSAHLSRSNLGKNLMMNGTVTAFMEHSW